MMGITGCKKDENNDVRVTTYTPQDITQTTAKCGGDVIVTQGLSLNELGVCWSMDRNPTVEDTHLSTQNWSEPYVCTITGLESGTTYHVRAYVLRGLEYYYGDDKSFTTEGNNGGGGGGGSWGSHAYVDLGLPSGTLWATCNVGAETPEDCGDYFAWGEIQPIDYYDWSTYQYCNGSYNTLIKYCTDASYGYNGFIDNQTTLLPEDDAATANWGVGWRVPTKAEWEELKNNTTVNWTTQNGLYGIELVASNGNSIFLPAVGHHLGSSLYFDGTSGFFWSSSLYTDVFGSSPSFYTAGPNNAWCLSFTSDICGMNYYYSRYNGQVCVPCVLLPVLQNLNFVSREYQHLRCWNE